MCARAQKHLIEVTEAIGARLEYFRELEKATRMLNLPGEELVLQEDFLNLLDRLDVCLDYLKANVRPLCTSAVVCSANTTALMPPARFSMSSYHVARLQGRRIVHSSIPAMSHKIDDSDQDVLCLDHSQDDC